MTDKHPNLISVTLYLLGIYSHSPVDLLNISIFYINIFIFNKWSYFNKTGRFKPFPLDLLNLVLKTIPLSFLTGCIILLRYYFCILILELLPNYCTFCVWLYVYSLTMYPILFFSSHQFLLVLKSVSSFSILITACKLTSVSLSWVCYPVSCVKLWIIHSV